MYIPNPLFNLLQFSLAHVGCILTPPHVVHIGVIRDPVWLPINSFHQRFSFNIPREYIFDVFVNLDSVIKYQLLECFFTLFETFGPYIQLQLDLSLRSPVVQFNILFINRPLDVRNAIVETIIDRKYTPPTHIHASYTIFIQKIWQLVQVVGN